MPADGVLVTSLTTGVDVAAESIGTRYFQQVKLVGGQSGSTEPIPGDSTRGLMVQWSSAMPVTVSTPMSVTGAVQVSGVAPVTTQASVSVAGLPVWLNPTQSVNVGNVVTVTATNLQISGPVSISAMPAVSIANVVPVTTAASVSVTGLPVWLNPTQTINVGNVISITGTSVNVVVSGLVSVTGTSLNVVVSGPVSISAMPVVSATGVLISIVSTVIGVVSVTGTSLNVVVSGPVSVSAMPAVSISVSAVLGTVVTVLGTQVVTLATGGTVAVLGSTTAASGVSGQIVWLGPNQATQTIVGLVSVTGTSLNVVVSGIVSVTGTSLNVVVSGPVSISAMPVVSMTGALVSIVSTILGTQIVTLATGGTVTLVGTVGASLVAPVSISGIVPVTTAASVSVTGIPVWLNPTQSVAVGVVSVTGTSLNVVVSGLVSVTGTSLNVVVSGPVSISAMPVVSMTGALVSIVSTILGTQIVTLATGGTVTLVGTVGASIIAAVSISGIVPVTTQASVSVTGIPVWLNPTQSVAVGVVSVTGTSLNVVVSGPVSISALPVVSMTGALVSIVSTVLGTVRISGTVDAALATTAVATTTQASGVTGALVYLAADQSMNVSVSVAATIGTITVVSTVVTILGTQIVTLAQIQGVTTAASVSVTGLPVWLNPTQQLVVSVSSLANVTTGIVSGATGQPVWPGTPVYSPFLAMVTVTSSIIPPTTLLFTVWTGITQAAAGTVEYVVPAGFNLRIVGFQVVHAISNVAQVNRYAVYVSSGAITVTSTVGIAVALAGLLTATTERNVFPMADVAAGRTIAIGVDVGNTRHVVVAIVVNGYLF